MSRQLTYARWQIAESLMKSVCYPEQARRDSEKSVQAVTFAYLMKLKADGKVLDLKPGDSFEVDGVKYEFV
jgi:hypothetical protein